jgi:hypothetical protein
MTLANAINKATKATGSQPAKEGQFYIFPYKDIQFNLLKMDTVGRQPIITRRKTGVRTI